MRALNDWRENLPSRKDAKFFVSHGESDMVVPYSDGALLAKLLQVISYSPLIYYFIAYLLHYSMVSVAAVPKVAGGLNLT